MNWPHINFLDPAPLPRGRKKATGFFDEYLPDSSEEEDEEDDKGVKKSIAEGFYGRSSRSTRSSRAPFSGNSRNPRSSGATAVDIEALEEEGLPARERAKKARHKARDMAKVKFSKVLRNTSLCHSGILYALLIHVILSRLTGMQKMIIGNLNPSWNWGAKN